MKRVILLIVLSIGVLSIAHSQPINLGFETGNITGWTLQEGGNQNSQTMSIYNIQSSIQYSVMLPSSTEINNVPVSMTSPYGGNSVRIGQTGLGGQSYKLSQTFTVDASSSALVFGYSLVMDNGGHICNEQNYYNLSVKDANGNVIPANTNTPSILNGSSCSSGDPSYSTSSHFGYKNWDNASYNLTNYIGTPVTVEFIVAGCSMNQGAHAGYAYFDASVCGNVSSPSNLIVNGNTYSLIQPHTTLDLCGSDTTTIWVPAGATSFSWTGGAINGLTTQSVSITQSGEYQLQFNKPSACSNLTSVTFSVGSRPALAITVPTNAVCPGTSINLTATGAASYIWASVSGTSQSTIYTPNYNVSPQITSVYSLTGKGANGCMASINYTVPVIVPPVLSVSGSTLLCPGNTTTLTASGADTYSWSTGATSNSIVITPTISTNYSVTGKSLSTGCSSVSYYYVTVGVPNIVANANKYNLCGVGDSTSVLGVGATSYTWSTGAITNPVVLSPTVTTTYTLSGTTTCGVKQTVFTLTVNPLPVITTVPNPPYICGAVSAQPSASGASTYTWSNGSTTFYTTVTPTVTTTYTVTGTDTKGCKNTATVLIAVYPAASITVNTSPTICSGQSTTLTINGATSYTWSTGSHAQSIVVSPTVSTNYTLAAVDANGCGYTYLNTIVNVASAVPSMTFAAGNTYTLCDGVGTHLTWYGSGGYYTYSISPTTNISPTDITLVTPTPSSSIVYTITAMNVCGASSNTILVVAKPSPTVTISGPLDPCTMPYYTFTGSGADSYSWSGLGYGTTSTVSVYPNNYTPLTLYGSSSNNCSSTASFTLPSYAPSLSTTIQGGPLCSGKSATLSVSGATSYLWNTGATTSSIVVSPPPGITAYSVVATNTNNCTYTLTQNVNVNPIPTITVNSESICLGNIFTMQPSGAVTYTYSSGSASTIPSVNTTYTVMGTNGYGCTASAVSSVSVNPASTITVNSGSICIGQIFTMNPAGGTIYFYSNGSNTVSPAGTSNYTVTGADANGCINTAVSHVYVNSGLTPTLSVNSGTICNGETFTIMPSGATTYSYSGGSAVVTPSVTTNYTITANPSGCVGSIISMVTVNPTPTITVNSGTICSGNNFTIVPAGANTYTYSSGSNIVTPASDINVSVTGTDINGCSDNIGAISSIIVTASPTISATSSAATVCENSSVNLNSAGADTYVWSTGDVTQSVTITPTVTSTYSVTGTDLNNCSSTQTVSVIVDNTCQDVWPGDANSDGSADNLDVLELGLHYLQTGTPRATISNNWQSYFANNWSGTITNGENVNNSDCNGDGIINDDDTLAIYTNYGLIHAFKQITQSSLIPELSIVPDQTTVVTGAWGSSSIYLGDATIPVNTINGVAFTVTFDNTLIEPNNIWIEYPVSFINAGNQNLHFRKLDFANDHLYTATTHTINNNVSGNGLIGILHYKIKSGLTADATLNIGLTQGYKSETSGFINPLTVGSTTVMAIGSSVGLLENGGVDFVSVSPNPTNGLLTISSKTDLQKVEVIAITGQILINETPTSNKYSLHLEDFANGIYFVNVYQNNHIVKREKVILNK